MRDKQWQVILTAVAAASWRFLAPDGVDALAGSIVLAAGTRQVGDCGARYGATPFPVMDGPAAVIHILQATSRQVLRMGKARTKAPLRQLHHEAVPDGDAAVHARGEFQIVRGDQRRKL